MGGEFDLEIMISNFSFIITVERKEISLVVNTL